MFFNLASVDKAVRFFELVEVPEQKRYPQSPAADKEICHFFRLGSGCISVCAEAL